MGDLLDSAKSAFFAAVKIYLVITIIVFLAAGPRAAATWVSWTGEQLKGAATSGQTFAEEVNK